MADVAAVLEGIRPAVVPLMLQRIRGARGCKHVSRLSILSCLSETAVLSSGPNLSKTEVGLAPFGASSDRTKQEPVLDSRGRTACGVRYGFSSSGRCCPSRQPHRKLAATSTGSSRTAAAIIPRRVVRITNTGTSQTQQLVTNDRGYFEAVLLNPGAYEVRVELQGYKTLTPDQHHARRRPDRESELEAGSRSAER